MLIGIDGNEANLVKRVGVNVYAFDLLWSIYKLQKKRPKKDDPIKFRIYLKDLPLKDLPPESDFWEYKVLSGKGIWILTKLMPHLMFAKDKPNVFFTPSHYLPPLAPMPKICSIMDLGYLEFSGQFRKYDYWQLKYWSAISISVSKKIITISKSSKRDIVRHYPSSSGKVEVTYPSYDPSRFNTNASKRQIDKVLNKYSIVGDYALFLSTLKPSKNVEGLLEAFSRFKDKKEGNNLKLVIAGKKGWLFDPIFKKVEELGLKKKIIFTGFIDEEDKPALVAGSRLFILPSYWEGFGLDPLYAMASGVPVIVSKTGSLPEVVGDAGIYIDPKDPKNIAEKIIKVHSMSKSEYNKLAEKGLKQAQKFSWDESAKKTLRILEASVN